MAICFCPADCSWCRLALFEQGSTMAKPSVRWFVFRGALCLVVGLLALPDILPANSICTCADIRTGHCRRLVGFLMEKPLASGANLLCRSPLKPGISES